MFNNSKIFIFIYLYFVCVFFFFFVNMFYVMKGLVKFVVFGSKFGIDIIGLSYIL